MRMRRPRVRSLGLQVPALGRSIVLRPGATRVAGTEPHAAKLPYESVVAAGDPASKAGGTAKRPFAYGALSELFGPSRVFAVVTAAFADRPRTLQVFLDPANPDNAQAHL